MTWSQPASDAGPVDLHIDQPHSARIYDYLLGGKDHFPADREAAEKALAGFPHARTTARQNRAFMIRAARHVAEAGVRQFLDIGTGIPTSPNLHEIVQGIAPDAQIVYTDNDPIVLTHARALLTGSPAGRAVYLDADLHDVEAILDSAVLRDTIDFSRPVGLFVVAVLHFFPDGDDPYGILRRLVESLPAGSYLALTHGTSDFDPAVDAQGEQAYRNRGIPLRLRRRAEIERFFDGLDLLDPGVRPVHRWRPDDSVPAGLKDAEVGIYGAVARRP
nr:SAM-dependent methyltransferase [Frankia canadensis]